MTKKTPATKRKRSATKPYTNSADLTAMHPEAVQPSPLEVFEAATIEMPPAARGPILRGEEGDALVARFLRQYLGARANDLLARMTDEEVLRGTGPRVTVTPGRHDANWLVAFALEVAAQERQAMLAITATVLSYFPTLEGGARSVLLNRIMKEVRNERGPIGSLDRTVNEAAGDERRQHLSSRELKLNG